VKIFIAEDDHTSALLLTRTLESAENVVRPAAVAASMSRTVLGMGRVPQILCLEELGPGIGRHVRELSTQLEALRV
jgi:hypothetical protein